MYKKNELWILESFENYLFFWFYGDAAKIFLIKTNIPPAPHDNPAEIELRKIGYHEVCETFVKIKSKSSKFSFL